jgi:hypothetical protein
MTITTMVLGVVVILISVGLLALVFMKSNQVNLTGKTDDKPEWMRSTPPTETMEATRADDEGVTIFNYDAGEKIAAPFAEQIEDILRAKLDSDPFNKFTIDFGTAKDGSLEIWVNEKMYTSVDEIPDAGLKQAFYEAVKKWESSK